MALRPARVPAGKNLLSKQEQSQKLLYQSCILVRPGAWPRRHVSNFRDANRRGSQCCATGGRSAMAVIERSAAVARKGCLGKPENGLRRWRLLELCAIVTRSGAVAPRKALEDCSQKYGQAIQKLTTTTAFLKCPWAHFIQVLNWYRCLHSVLADRN